jgi:putative transposase
MEDDFYDRHPRFQIGQNDRVIIGGLAFRLLERTDDAWFLIPAGRDGFAEAYTIKRMNELNGAGEVRKEVDYFLPPQMRMQQLRPAFALRA